MAQPAGPESEPKVHVGIVGAGIAGLRCADILLSLGLHVTVLEARNRIGGRICRSDELGYAVELGPNWIHIAQDYADSRRLHDIAVEMGTPMHRFGNAQRTYYPSGELMPDTETQRLSALLWSIIEEAFEFSAAAHKRDGGREISPHESLLDFVKRRIAELAPETEHRSLEEMSHMWGAYIGEPVWKQSLRFAWMEECCSEDDMFVESTWSSILERIARPALQGGCIQLNQRVTRIETPEMRAPGQKVVVLTHDENVYLFDEVVVAAPLGWLKMNPHVFSPTLPPRLDAAVRNISLSHLEKVFITFPSAFWRSEQATEFPCYVNWLSPEYAADTNPSRWPQEMWDLSVFPPPNNHPTLLFYLYGECSQHVVEMVHGKSGDEKFTRLDDFFRPYYCRLPNYCEGDPECKPKAILSTAWLKDELSGCGSYCNFLVGIEEADKDVLVIRAGCEDRRLWFCGEHASPLEACGTATGAYLSGELVAQRMGNLVRDKTE